MDTFSNKNSFFFFLSSLTFYPFYDNQAVYTYFTGKELGETPFLCPSDYSYTSKTARLICQVRAANLICMWLMVLSNLLVTITTYIPGKAYKEMAKNVGYKSYNNEVGGRLNSEESQEETEETEK